MGGNCPWECPGAVSGCLAKHFGVEHSGPGKIANCRQRSWIDTDDDDLRSILFIPEEMKVLIVKLVFDRLQDLEMQQGYCDGARNGACDEAPMTKSAVTYHYPTSEPAEGRRPRRRRVCFPLPSRSRRAVRKGSYCPGNA